VLSLSFEGEPDGKPFHSWREEIAREYLDMDVEPLGTDLFRAAVRLNVLPGLLICDATGTPQRNSSPPETNRRSGVFGVLLSRGTRIRHEQGGRSTELEDGGVLLADLSRPWQTDFAPFQRATAVVVDHETLLELVPGVESLSARAIPAQPRLVALLASTLDVAIEHGPYLDPLAREALSRHILDLVALALGAREDAAEQAKKRGLAAALRMAIRATVLEMLADPGLSVTTIAVRHGVSVRYIQKLFEEDGMTFTQFVVEQRLLSARRKLTSASERARSISEIALACGFGDISHFNRLFRRRYGATPSDIRAHALTGEGATKDKPL
jgi:AraC-like DNA-binding protein